MIKRKTQGRLSNSIAASALLLYFASSPFCVKSYAKENNGILKIDYNMIPGNIYNSGDVYKHYSVDLGNNFKMGTDIFFLRNDLYTIDLKKGSISERYRKNRNEYNSSVDYSDDILPQKLTIDVDSAPVAEPSTTDDDNDRKKERKNKNLEFIYQALNLIDTGETLSCLHAHTCHENNPLFGRNPSDAKLIAMKSAAAALHYAIYRVIKKDAQEASLFEYISIGIQGGVVIWNAAIRF